MRSEVSRGKEAIESEKGCFSCKMFQCSSGLNPAFLIISVTAGRGTKYWGSDNGCD